MTESPVTDDRDPVDVIAEEFADRFRRGEQPSIADYLSRHPALAAELREVLPGVAQLELAKRQRLTAERHLPEPPGPRPPRPDRFGDFRIRREIARGGMGIVYEAVHESLHRRVALKVLSTSMQSPNSRERFLREAQAAARLHHTNIVPVFSFGEQDGLPYYVMPLIRGPSLSRLIQHWRQSAGGQSLSTPATTATRPDGWRDSVPISQDATNDAADDLTDDGDDDHPTRLAEGDASPASWPARQWSFMARVGLEAAEALHAAHEQGVLHRDVKPGNLLIDIHGRAWVTDFGLAKLLDHHSLTATGDVLGTLAYMPPEALQGRVSPQADVYSLGATLYEMATLQPPHVADTPGELIRLIDTRDPLPVRRIDPSVPRDLETIIMKALARDPAQRYATASAMAADLAAILQDRPITARRLSWWSHGLRWVRRHPAIAGLSVSTVAALLLAGTVGWVGYGQARTAYARAEEQRRQAEELAARLQANLELSLASFEKLFDAASQDGPRPAAWVPGEANDKLAVLETILDFYDKFAEQNATHPRLQFEAAKANRRIGEMQWLLGRSEKAEAAFRRAADSLETLRQGDPDAEPILLELLLTYAHAPLALFESTDWRNRLLSGWNEGRPPSPRLRGPHGEVGLRLASVEEAHGHLAEAESIYRTLLRQRLVQLPAPLPPVEQRIAWLARLHLAELLLRTDRLPEAKRLLDPPFIREWDPFELRGPWPPGGREQLAQLYQAIAESLEKQGEPALARRMFAIRNALPPRPPGASLGRDPAMAPKTSGPFPLPPRPSSGPSKHNDLPVERPGLPPPAPFPPMMEKGRGSLPPLTPPTPLAPPPGEPPP